MASAECTKKKGLSFLIGATNSNDNHILPINATQYSSSRLYTAGRDGTVKTWQHENASIVNTTTKGVYDEDESGSSDIHESLLKLETAISSNTLPHTIPEGGDFKITNSHNLHFDWINDIQLINNDQHLASCSSDLSIKILDLASNAVHKLPNVHTDYIKKLAYSSDLVSGGLDGNVVYWDLDQLRPIQIIENRATGNLPTSIYSLAKNDHVISTGGPSNTINLYDSRSSQFIRSLIGHQDNIRCLLMNDQFLLSGSSDTLIKMWDLRTFKVYKNFDIHDFPVWSLSGNMCEFYSGDRGGNVVKTDLSNLFINKQDRFFENTFTSNECTSIDEKLGISTIIARNELPIVSICHGDDNIFISDYDSLTRYVNPNTSSLAQYQFLKTCVDYSPVDDSLIDDLQSQPNEDLNSAFYDLVSHLSMDTTPNNEMQSTYSVENTEPTESYNSMFLNVNGGASIEFINAYQQEPKFANPFMGDGNGRVDEFVDSTPIEILLNPAEHITPIPFNSKPISRYEIVPHSVISKRIFNNKRQIIALYLNGDIRIWDILICKELLKFPSRHNKLLTGKELEYRIKEMDDLVQKYQSSDTLNNWCEVEIKAGKLLVTIKDTSVMNVEIYYDDMVKDYPYLSIDHPETVARMGNHKISVSDDDRFHLGLILLNSIFHGYTMYEWVFDELMREEIRQLQQQQQQKTTDSDSITSRLKNWRKPSKRSLNEASPINSTSASVADMPLNPPLSEFLNTPEESLAKSIPSYNDTIMSLLQTNKKIYHERSKPGESVLRVNYVNPCLNPDNDDELKYFPVINPKHFPPDFNVILFEYSPELGNYRDLSYFKICDINNLPEFPQQELINELRCSLPRWIGQPILYNRFSIKESPKITFRLLEVDYFSLPPSVKIGGKSQRKIKSLPALESSIKLTSHNMLRVSKILYFLTDKFEASTKEMKDKKLKPTDWLALECKGQELSNSMTLQTIKTKIWKSSSDIELSFRRKFD